ncbi:MAG: glycosyl transferase [Bacteroidia bacterium]
MALNFCTLFDSNYISRGLAMHESLMYTCPDFRLFIFAFDDKAAVILNKLNLKNVTVITLGDFETEELLKIKPTRTRAEYCWTCTPSIIFHCITRFNLTNCTYLDADLLFYSDPSILIEEMGNDSVLITEHRYTPEYDHTKTSGKYCVQFMFFKNDERGMQVLNWWRNECIKWCYNRYEDGKFGDQKYLDDWTTRFSGVHELKHIGGGVAPWNLQQYIFKNIDDKIFLRQKNDKEYVELVFVHFHDVTFFSGNLVKPSSYFIPKKIIHKLYFPYIKRLMHFSSVALSFDSSINPNATSEKSSENRNYSFKGKVSAYLKSIRKLNLKELALVSKKTRTQYYQI